MARGSPRLFLWSDLQAKLLDGALVIDALFVGANVMRQLFVHLSRSRPRAKVLGDASGLSIDSKEGVKVVGASLGANGIGLTVAAVKRARRWVAHFDECLHAARRLHAFSLVLGVVFPEHGRLFGPVVRVESDRIVGGVQVIPLGPRTNPDVDFFALKEHGRAAVVRDAKGEMAPRKGEASRPKGLQHRRWTKHGVDFDRGPVP